MVQPIVLILGFREIPWAEECGGHSLWGHKESDTSEHEHD